jgi:ArsR family transcriptional regulator
MRESGSKFMGPDQSARLFRALGDVTRQRLLLLLLQQELSVSELVRVLGQPQSTVSRHLKVLREAELVADRRDGTNVLYAASRQPSNGQTSGLRDRIREWMDSQHLPSRLAKRLDRVLKERQRRSESFFSGAADRWDQLREAHFGRRFHLEALTALLPPEWTVADVGTGTGFLLPVLGRTFEQVIAVELVPEMLLQARSRPELEGMDHVSFRQGSADALPIRDGSVDLAVSVLVWHHVASPPAALAELWRILKPRGRILIVEQTAHEFKEFYERMQDRWWGFEPGDLAVQVAEGGFDDVRCRPIPLDQERSAKSPEAPGLFVLTACKREPSSGAGGAQSSAWAPEGD